MTEHKASRKVERSKNYPYYGIQDCVSFIRIIDNLGGRTAVSPKSVLSQIGLTNQNTRSFTAKISSSRQFGLITNTAGNLLQLTERGRLILYPVRGEEQRKQLLVDSFKSAPLYDKLIKRFEGKELPNRDTLSNILLNEFGISKAVKDRAAKVFITSAKYVGALDNENILLLKEDQDDHEIEYNEHNNTKFSEEHLMTQNTHPLEIPLTDGKTAKVIIPRDINKKDVERIGKVLGALID